jgi:hypothetical protein
MLLAIYNCISIPFDAAFSPEANLYYDLWEGVVDIMFAIDVVINFRTTYVNGQTGLEVTSGWKIAKNYIKSGRFFVDLMASIPFERVYQVIFPNAENNQAL